MITFECDACERALEVDDDLGGKKVRCPHCGDVNVVPGGAGGGPVLPVAKEGARPTPDARAGAEDEEDVMRVHPAMFRARPLRGLLILVMVLGGFAGAVFFWQAGPVVGAQWDPILAWVCAGVGVLGVLWWAVWRVATWDTSLTITTRRTVWRKGLLSKMTREIAHDQIKNITVTQTFAQRLLRTGTIGIDSSGQDTVEIVVKDVPRPARVQETINRYRNL